MLANKDVRSEAPLGGTHALSISTKTRANTLTASETESIHAGLARIAAYCTCVGTLSTPHHQYTYEQSLSVSFSYVYSGFMILLA